jgi:hypothetical protein
MQQELPGGDTCGATFQATFQELINCELFLTCPLEPSGHSCASSVRGGVNDQPAKASLLHEGAVSSPCRRVHTLDHPF